MGVIFLMPFIGRWKLGHRFNIGLLCALLAGAGLLDLSRIRRGRENPTYQAAVKGRTGRRNGKGLAHSPAGIPSAGAAALLRSDPLTQGPSCSRRIARVATGTTVRTELGGVPKSPQSASDLKGFGSREWLAGLLNPERISTTNYFGGTKFADGKMSKFVKKNVTNYTPEQREQLKKVIAAVSAEAQLKSQSAADQRGQAIIAEGRALLKDAMKCTDCHQFRVKDEEATAPDLTGYASREWLVQFLTNPGHDRFYGSHNDRMPAFGEKQILSAGGDRTAGGLAAAGLV